MWQLPVEQISRLTRGPTSLNARTHGTAAPTVQLHDGLAPDAVFPVHPPPPPPQPAELAARSAWCRQYALVNAAALRKVTKKHDKYCGGSAGSRFLQACWDAGHGEWGGFLHSPLMVLPPDHSAAAKT